MDKLCTLLKKIQERPGLYVGETSFDKLIQFIGGYRWRDFELDPNHKDCLDGFLEFVRRYYNDYNDAINWFDIIAENTKNDEEALYKFFELFDEFTANAETQNSHV